MWIARKPNVTWIAARISARSSVGSADAEDAGHCLEAEAHLHSITTGMFGPNERDKQIEKL